MRCKIKAGTRGGEVCGVRLRPGLGVGKCVVHDIKAGTRGWEVCGVRLKPGLGVGKCVVHD